MEHLIALLQAAQDGDGVLHRRFTDQNGLETTLQSRVFFNIFTVLVQSRGTDAVQLAPCQHGFQEITRVHAALGLACADDGVQLVDKEDDAALGAFDLVEYGLQTLLKLAPVLGAGDQRAHVQGEDGLVLQGLGHVAPDDPLSKALGNGGLAYAGLADENRVVFRFTGQNTDDVADLLVPADNRIGLLFPRLFHQVGAVFLQSLVGALGIVGGDPRTAAHGLEGLQGFLLGDAVVIEQGLYGVVRRLQHGKEQVLHGDVIVPHGGLGLLRLSQQTVYAAGDVELVRLPPGTADGRQLFHCGLGCGRQAFHGDVHFFQKLRQQAALLLYHRQEQMHLLDLLILVLRRQCLGIADGFQGFLCEFIGVHRALLSGILACMMEF